MERGVICDTPIGRLAIAADGDCVVSIRVVGSSDYYTSLDAPPVATQAAKEVSEYFEGKRTRFSFPVKFEGTAFQKSVWNELINIPYGTTMTYGEIAKLTGNPGAARAVGMACNRNPLLIAVPCHRVTGADNKLTGYAAGIEKKRLLLELEKRNSQQTDVWL